MEGDFDASVDEIEQMLAGSLHRAVTGDVEMGSLMSGQVACLVHDEKPAAQIVDDLMNEAYTWCGKNLTDMAAKNAERAWKEA